MIRAPEDLYINQFNKYQRLTIIPSKFLLHSWALPQARPCYPAFTALGMLVKVAVEAEAQSIGTRLFEYM